MRFIEWDDSIEDLTLRVYKKLNRGYANTKNRDYGCVAESLVQKYYNKPLHLDVNGTDCGYDLVLYDDENNEVKIDVKNHCNKVDWFSSENNYWSVASYNGLKADYYLFTELDYNNKKIALIGYLTKEELVNCSHINKGEQFKLKYYQGIATSDCYIVKMNEIHPIS